MKKQKDPRLIIDWVSPFYEKKIHDLEFILMICQYIENLKIVSQHKNKKVDKHAMLQTIFHILFNIDPNSEEIENRK